MPESPSRSANAPSFDFETWARLAQSDPAAFEAKRKALIKWTIEQAQPRQRERLHRLQWKIDQIRALSTHPLGACIRITKLMWHSLAGPRGLRASFEWLEHESDASAQTAKILSFENPRRHS